MKWPLLLLLAALPLQWFVVAGPLRLHLVAMLAFLVVVVVSLRSRAFVPVLRATAPFVVATVALCVVWLGANAYHGLGARQPVQQLAYLAVFVAVGTVVHRGLADGRWIEMFRWTALVVVTSLLVALSISMSLNGVNAAAVFGQTIASADPEILQKELFRSSFTGFGYNVDSVRGNFRHEVFGAVVVAMTMSAACVALRPFQLLGARNLYRVSMVLGTTLIVLSMSRSIMIAAAAWPLLAVLRGLLNARISPRLLGGAILAAAAAAMLTVTGALQVVWVRFTEDTSSYQARDNLYERSFQDIGANFLTGGVATAGRSSHNFVLDTWLRAGVFGAAAAVTVTLLLLGLLLALAVNLHREPPWMLPVTAMLLLPLVRMFTAGGGMIPPVSWVALGLAAGFIVHRRTTRRAAPESPGIRVTRRTR